MFVEFDVAWGVFIKVSLLVGVTVGVVGGVSVFLGTSGNNSTNYRFSLLIMLSIILIVSLFYILVASL